MRPDRWLSIEKWFMDDTESLSLDEKETSTGESKVAGEEGEFSLKTARCSSVASF